MAITAAINERLIGNTPASVLTALQEAESDDANESFLQATSSS